MQIYQKNGVTGKLCQHFSVAGSMLLLRSIFCASVWTRKLKNQRLVFRLLLVFVRYPFSIHTRLTSSTILLLS